jgi:hypothetical protein
MRGNPERFPLIAALKRGCSLSDADEIVLKVTPNDGAS